MTPYHPPIEDTLFLYRDVFRVQNDWTKWNIEQLDLDLARSILEQGGKVAAEIMDPLSKSADEDGAQWDNGTVFAPPGFKDAFQSIVEGGWIGLSGNPEYGGQGLPASVSFAVEEYFWGANTTFWLYASLTDGATHCIETHASEELKQQYLPRMYEGTWTGAMSLTESHAGTDLGMLRTSAKPTADGRYLLNGTKIFITSGEHDLAENIIHLVLARLPDAPPGSKGISLFLVPKFLLDDEGNAKERNGFVSASIEKKMGIHGSATSTIIYEDAVGYLVGEPHQGLACMFTMMNSARLSVGIQGLGFAERAYQMASEYVKVRLQGRSPSGPTNPSGPADPIIKHPEVRRNMLIQRTLTEGGRAFSVLISHLIDESVFASDEAERKQASRFVELLTPIAKAFLTDRALETTLLAQGCFGGHGYIKETGIEQLVRDTRITQIYEGTNAIQAMDLIGRKVLRNRGSVAAEFANYMRKTSSEGPFAGQLNDQIKQWGELTQTICNRAGESASYIGGSAVEYLDITGYVIYAWLWNRMAAQDDGSRYKHKLAQFYFNKVMPRILSLENSILNGTESLDEIQSSAI